MRITARSFPVLFGVSLLVAQGGCIAGGATPDDAAGVATAREAEGKCFVAFLHGRGDDRRGLSQDDLETYWTSSAGNTDDSMTDAAATSRGCTTLRVGYNGKQAFWHDEAAGTAADQIAAFIEREHIGPGQLVLVAHSMGALVARFIVDNGEANAPYFNLGGHDFAAITAATRHFVTIQGPHTGVETADAIFGEADTWYANGGGSIVTLFGVDKGDPAADCMRRLNMEYASASGGWMGDAGRTRRMYTVASNHADKSAGVGWKDDVLLDLAWGAVCHHPHAINLWLCRTIVPGDGLVEERSASGRIMRASGDSGELAWHEEDAVQGARTDWLHTGHNHNHGRMNRLAQNIDDNVWPGSSTEALGDYLGDSLLALPR